MKTENEKLKEEKIKETMGSARRTRGTANDKQRAHQL